MIKKIKASLKELGFNDKEIAVYISLTQLGEATASDVAKKADLPRTTVIGILNNLRRNNFLTSHFHKGKTYYWIESPKIIGSIFEQKMEIANILNKLLVDLYRTQAHFPSVRVFDNKSSIKKFIERLLAGASKKTIFYTIDSPASKNYAKIYFEDIGNLMLKEKMKKDIFTQSLIPYGSFGAIDEYKLKNQSIKIREMPEDIKFEASLWLIEDIVVHFSGNPVFLTVTRHEAVFKSLKSIYDFLWDMSIPKN